MSGLPTSPVASPLVCGQVARMCLRGHPKFNPWEHRNSEESLSRFLSPHTPFVGTRPGFCSGTHGLYQLSADLYSPPENGILNGSFQPQKDPPQSNPRPGRAVRLSCSKLIGITKPDEIMEHQTCLHQFKKSLLCSIHTEEGKWIAKKMIYWSLLSIVSLVRG